MSETKQAQVVVLGGGPGGYTAAFRAADLGQKVILIEKHERIGGVCLNVGCIPSKALLHTAEVINEAKEAAHIGVKFAAPEIDIDGVRANKENVIEKLTSGLAALAKARSVEIVRGTGSFTSATTIDVATAEGTVTVEFENCVIAVGSRVVELPFIPHADPRVWDSTDALKLKEVPKRLLILGGGIIGLEMATVYQALGSSITIVEMMDQIIPPADKDMVMPLTKSLKGKCENIFTKTKVTEVTAQDDGILVKFEGKKAPEHDKFDAVLVSIGRRPNGLLIDAEKAGINVDEQGFIAVNEKMQTNAPNIYAIGDVVGQPMLAHKAVHEGKVAAEVIDGHDVAFTPMTIPSVAYTSPEVAWMGLTEKEAKANGIAYEKGVIPWAASGRAQSMGAENGKTKLLFDPETNRILGAAIVGKNAGELLAEACLALEMGATAEDIGMTIHAHPTLSETLAFAAEMYEGTITDLMPPKKK